MSHTPTSQGSANGDADTPGSLVNTQYHLGRYLLIAKLGEGGMGAVYKAQHTKLKKIVTLKLLPVDRMMLPGMVERFHQEMEAIGRLEHPNIIRATDAGEDRGQHYLVMEYVEGQDLLKILRARKTLPEAQACALVRQAALGLQYIADQGLVHRDIKPSNLLLSTTGQVKILDLGLALLKKATPSAEEELTTPGQIMGTWDYMAPEQTRDSHRVDIRADIYSLGCTFYKLLTGKAPFASYETYRAKATAHCEFPVPSVTSLGVVVSDHVQRVLDRMLAKNPEDRFQNPVEITRALEPFVGPGDLSAVLPLASSDAGSLTPDLSLAAGEETGAKEGSTGVAGPTVGNQPLQPRPRLRRLWQVAKLSVVALCLLAVALGIAILLRDRGREEKPEISEDEPIVLGRWYPLMTRPPRQLLWSKNIAPPVWYKERAEILAAAEGPGHLGLGTVQTKQAYRFRVMLRQNQWAGQAGVLFGYREETLPQETIVRFQTIELIPGLDGPDDFRMMRRKTVLRITSDGKKQFSSEQLASERVGRPTLSEHALEITVMPYGLQSVLWEGAKLEALCTQRANRSMSEEDYGGALGVFVNNSMAKFRDGQIMYLER